MQHLLHLQAYFSEAAAERQEVFGPGVCRAGHVPVQGRALQLRGTRAAGAGGEAGPARG